MYADSETLFEERKEVHLNSGKSQKVKNKPSDIIDPPRFSNPSKDMSLPNEEECEDS